LAQLASVQATAPAMLAGTSTFAASTSTKVPSSHTKGAGYVYYRYGNQADVTTTPAGGVALEGGGTVVDRVYTWMGNSAKNGDFLVLRTSGTDAYDSYIYKLNQSAGAPLNSVSTLIITSSAATTNQFVLDKINHAEAIFIAGGDQSTYVNLWQNTSIETAINQAVARGVPVGGTSAGLAVLGQYVYSAKNASAVSSTVLANPYDSSITLDQDFLSIPGQQSLPDLGNTITDSHFYERDRMGRLVTFLARLVEDPRWTPPSSGPPPSPTDPPTLLTGTKGIGIDEETALLIDTAGNAQVVANSSTDPNARHLYFLETLGTSPTVQSGTTLAAPLTWGNSSAPAVEVHRASLNDTFNLPTLWTNLQTYPDTYALWAINGTLSSSNGAIY
jgi:cyanophycinase-like exopeptidase